jgi:hypothetical protein
MRNHRKIDQCADLKWGSQKLVSKAWCDGAERMPLRERFFVLGCRFNSNYLTSFFMFEKFFLECFQKIFAASYPIPKKKHWKNVCKI